MRFLLIALLSVFSTTVLSSPTYHEGTGICVFPISRDLAFSTAKCDATLTRYTDGTASLRMFYIGTDAHEVDTSNHMIGRTQLEGEPVCLAHLTNGGNFLDEVFEGDEDSDHLTVSNRIGSTGLVMLVSNCTGMSEI